MQHRFVFLPFSVINATLIQFNESMVSLVVLRQYMRGENRTEKFGGLFFSVLLIRIGKQNVKIIVK